MSYTVDFHTVSTTQKSKLAGTIRGSYFVIKGQY